MTINSNQEHDAVFAEEAFIVDAQLFLHNLMEEKGFSRAALAKAMGVSRARISQVFSDECKNFTMRLFARAVHALDEKPRLMCDHFERQLEQAAARQRDASIDSADNVVPFWGEMVDDADISDCLTANDNRLASLRRKAA